MLYLTKNDKNKVISLIAFLCANMIFAIAFCFLFVSDVFSYDYYNWLKLINSISFVLLGLGIVLGGMLLTKYYLNKTKVKDVLWNIFTTTEILIILLAFVNIISFYEGVVYILLLIGVGCYAIGAIGGILYYNTSTLVETQLKHSKPVEEFVFVLNSKTKLKSLMNIKDLNNASRIINFKFIIGVILTVMTCLVSSVLFFVFASGLTTNDGLAWMFVVITCLLLILGFCCFLIPLFITNKRSFNANKWAVLILVIINELLFSCVAVLLFLGLGSFISIVYPIVMMCLLNVSSVLLINDYAKLKYVLNSIA